MSKEICTSAIDGAIAWVARAEAMLDAAVKQKGEDRVIGFPDTAYFLPVIHSFTGEKVRKASDARRILVRAKELLPQRPSENVWLPYLGSTLDAGVAALFACEIIEACKYLVGPDPINGIWLGAASDVIMRERGIEFVDGTAPGFAAITGAAPTNKIAVSIARQLQEKNLYVFMAGCSGGKQFAEQLAEEGVQLGWETRLIPFGRDVSALIYALGFANRAALSFGGVAPGDYASNLRYNKSRIFAFVLALGEVTPDKYAAAAGAINYGFPVIADTDIPQILPSGVCTYEHVVSGVSHESIVERALEVRGCKIKITKVPVPVSYGAAFEGERIRKADVHAEFGGNKTTAFEFVTSVDMDAITDGDISVIGPDIDAAPEGSMLPLAIWVEVAGRKMQPDFEPILERQIHHLVNGAEGIWHMGQRDIVWTRVSKAGFAKGLRLRHYGEILHARFLSDYPAIVDKVKVTLVTDPAEVEKRAIIARKTYDDRNRRMEAMTDESVEVFYSCLLCQSFAPNHVCIITPERLGLCGAYNWLDGKAAYEIDETGPNQPVKKGDCIDPVKGIWKGIDEFVYLNSHKTIQSFCAYSIMDRPMTSCGCFEVICAYVPECNGIIAVNREYMGETPVGMTFSSLAGNVGGGVQTPGFIGCGKVYLTSKKFLFAEGGHKRLVWMPSALKGQLGDDLKKRFEEQGAIGLMEKIADETTAMTAEELRAFLEKTAHPALAMEDMGAFVQSASDAQGSSSQKPPPEKPAKAPSVVSSIEEGDHYKEKPAESLATADLVSRIKEEVIREIVSSLSQSPNHAQTADIVAALSSKYLGADTLQKNAAGGGADISHASKPGPARAKIAGIKAFSVRKEKCEAAVRTVRLGATKAEGGSRGKTHTIGGATCMPFHFWEGEMPNRPLLAMEVFDSINEKFPEELKKAFGDLIHHPAEMAKLCVDKYGADLISVRLEATHPEKGNRPSSSPCAW